MQTKTTPEMTAAIVVVTQLLRGAASQTATGTASPWSLAMRRPDLDRDDLRALARGARGH